ncbi:MAG: hypothetical protein OXB93_05595 [Cytophagales bacterium]|nr:hypothetical protein [Cytophagales bacterium]
MEIKDQEGLKDALQSLKNEEVKEIEDDKSLNGAWKALNGVWKALNGVWKALFWLLGMFLMFWGFSTCSLDEEENEQQGKNGANYVDNQEEQARKRRLQIDKKKRPITEVMKKFGNLYPVNTNHARCNYVYTSLSSNYNPNSQTDTEVRNEVGTVLVMYLASPGKFNYDLADTFMKTLNLYNMDRDQTRRYIWMIGYVLGYENLHTEFSVVRGDIIPNFGWNNTIEPVLLAGFRRGISVRL